LRLAVLGALRLFAANHLKSLSMNNLQPELSISNQGQSRLIKANRVISCVSTSQEEPNGVLEWWGNAKVVKFSHPSLQYSNTPFLLAITPSLHHSITPPASPGRLRLIKAN
jgi:hypothetical protein